MPRNEAAAPGHDCQGIRIHAIDIVQPPGIGIPPIADMDAHQTIVAVALAAKSSAETPKNAPTTLLSACRTRRGGATRRPSRCAPLVRGIGVVDDAVLEHERAHARQFAQVRGRVDSGHDAQFGDSSLAAGLQDRRHVHRPVVVIDGPRPLLLLCERDAEVEVEVAAE
jgi:hypothetical protein